MKDPGKCDKARETKRSTLACLSCRSVRQKCNGEPPEGLLDQHSNSSTRESPVKSLQPCDRCILNQHECLWNQSRRFGRPRKAQRMAGVQPGLASPAFSSSSVRTDTRGSSASLPNINAETSSSRSPTDYKAPIQTNGVLNLLSDENAINLSDVLSLMQSDVDTLSWFEQGQAIPEVSSSMALNESTWSPIMDQSHLHMDENAAPKLTIEPMSFEAVPLISLAAVTSSTNSSTLLSAGIDIGEENRDNLDELTLQGFQRYVELSLDPPPMTSEDTTRIRRVLLEPLETRLLGERSLYLAMAAAGYRMAGEDFTLADSLFEESFNCIQQYLSNSDRGDPDIIGAVDAMHAIQACSVLAPYAYGTRSVFKAEELLLGAAQLAVRHDLHQLDSTEASNDHLSFRAQMNSLASGIWKLRIRCAAILVESLSVERAQGGAAKARLQALDTMVSNLQKALRGSDRSLIVKNECKNRKKLHAMIVASEIMLYGAQIHLHRLRWVPTFNLKLRGCSFNVLNNVDRSAGNLDEVSRTNESLSFINELENETEYDLARQSMATIHSCANKILKLIPNEAEEGCEKAEQKSNSPTTNLPITTFYRWPYFACVQVIAAFGQLIGLTAHRRSASCRPSTLHISNMMVGICMDAQCTPEELIAFPRQDEDNALPVKWLRLEACSNLQLAESMLLCMEVIWPVAENSYSLDLQLDAFMALLIDSMETPSLYTHLSNLANWSFPFESISANATVIHGDGAKIPEIDCDEG
ncbi:hypothetical protein INT43_005809 [Umbelopsis isabellina]|uniref:Zn(2)-C6 fungal-type domain-containing protein n=1 Tax=Mortierella isabellina TaxID=91625 RepID=A0A8H7PK76_MORIS|nr:hypothetical protein INT43_005809 [Umbelopsis isabellina]